MQKRRVIALTISLILILGIIAPAFAAVETIAVSPTTVERAISIKDADDNMKQKEKEAKISKDKAIEIAKEKLKEYFNYEIDEKKFKSTVEFRKAYGYDEKYIWTIYWRMYERNTNISIHININADDGKITSIQRHEHSHDEGLPTIVQITREEAKVIADEFIKRVNPKEYKEVKLQERDYTIYRHKANTSYYFMYTRERNGVPFPGNSIAVHVDGIKSEIRGYSYTWDNDIQFQDTEGIIDKEKAEQVLRDNIDMVLNYIPNRNSHNEKVKEIKLIYNPKFENGYFVDAKEGTLIDREEKSAEEKKVKDITDERKEEIFKNAKKSTKPGKEISKERAREVIEKYINEIYGEGYELDELEYLEEDYWQTNGKKAWSARYNKYNGSRRHYGGKVIINALTEELISTFSYNNIEDEIEEGYKPIITWEQGYDKAIEVIAKYFPHKIKAINTEAKYRKYIRFYNDKEMPELEYNFNFKRQVNGIDYNHDNIYIDVDTKEGKIKEIRCQWTEEVEFPKPTEAMTKEDAVEAYFEKHKPELIYTRINKNDDHKNPDWEIKLVYRLANKYYTHGSDNIDAFTGKLLSYFGQELGEEEKADGFKEKIKGHDSEKELGILASQGIIDTKEFELDKEITMDEAIKMLVDVKGYNSYMVREAEDLKFSNVTETDDNYKYLQMAVKYGILENKESKYKGDSKITREDLAEMMVKLLGHDEIAKINSIFKVSYKDKNDISKEKIGYVAICEGLNIIKDINGKFQPKDNATIVDMAIAIYNVFGNLKKH